jgi:hypothetical protein
MDNSHQNYNKDREMEKPEQDEQSSRRATGSNDPSHREPGAGITNRPDEIERENQERLPPRGQEKAAD